MSLPRWTCLGLMAATSLVADAAPREKTFSLADSVLLFGNYNDLRVITPDGAQQLRPPIDLKYNGGYFVFPSIAQSGDMISWGFATEASPAGRDYRIRFAVGLYAVQERRWRTYGDFEGIGDSALSPSGSKVALLVSRQRHGKASILLFDRVAESFSEGPAVAGVSIQSNLSWSPDETHLVTDIYHEDQRVTVAVLDPRSGHSLVLGQGVGGRWSPDGQWIAYYSGDKCLLIHPDGTGMRVATTLTDSWFTSRSFTAGGPVWSPDSKRLLLNVSKNERPFLDVVSLDLLTGRLTRMSRSGLPVFGWVPYQHQPWRTLSAAE